MKAIQIDVPGVDYAGFIDERVLVSDPDSRSYQSLYLRKGSRVVYASYSGAHDLMDKISLYADQLK